MSRPYQACCICVGPIDVREEHAKVVQQLQEFTVLHFMCLPCVSGLRGSVSYIVGARRDDEYTQHNTELDTT